MIRVLAVEDSPTQAERLRADLTSAGFIVTMVSGADEALDSLTRHSYDVMLTDVVMPGMNGFDLCRAVKQTEEGRDLPVILLTSLADPLDVVRGLEAGADNFIRKPYQVEQLLLRLWNTEHNRALRRTSRVQLGIQLSFMDREFQITAERQQILDLLISTFEELVVTSRQMRAREQEMTRLHAKAEQQLRVTQIERNRLNTVLDSVPVPIVVMDDEGAITHMSQAGMRAFETTLEELDGPNATYAVQFVDPDGMMIPLESLPLRRAAAQGLPCEMGSAFDLLLARPDGTQVPVVLKASPVFDDQGRAAGSVGSAHLLGAVKQYDPVTGLPNRTAFGDRVVGALASPQEKIAVLLVGLDRPYVARATLEYQAIDDPLVITTARELRNAVGDSAELGAGADVFLAYLGGDEFGIILAGARGDEVGALRMANRLRGAVSDGSETSIGTRVTASVGASLAGDSADASRLLAAAAAALRRARAAGGDRVELFDSEASQQAIDRVQLEIDLREAIDNGSVHLQYQPEIDLATGRIIGFEALARWQHDQRGPIAPDVFIPLAEESGLILTLGQHVLGTACRQVAAWTASGHLRRDQTMSVNISAVQLRPELVDEVVDVLARTGVDARQLILEITETTAMSEPRATVAIIEQLRALGVRFSLDDFGTGYSSLAYLSRIPFDQLKLDRSFVSGITHDGTNATIAQSVIALGHALGVQVLAEGIEEPDQADALRLLGCDQAQGYLFARPLSPEDAKKFLALRGEPRNVGSSSTTSVVSSRT